jgi:hypothetical protein
MASNAWLSGAVAVANAATQALGLQVDVTIEAWIRQDVIGDDDYATPVTRSALVQEGVLHHQKADGQIVTTKARLSFLDPIQPNGAVGRQEPVDPRDIFTLPSGLTGRPIEVPGVLVDSQTGHPYVSTVWLA